MSLQAPTNRKISALSPDEQLLIDDIREKTENLLRMKSEITAELANARGGLETFQNNLDEQSEQISALESQVRELTGDRQVLFEALREFRLRLQTEVSSS
jgi:chromosome segregation ATPase